MGKERNYVTQTQICVWKYNLLFGHFASHSHKHIWTSPYPPLCGSTAPTLVHNLKWQFLRTSFNCLYWHPIYFNSRFGSLHPAATTMINDYRRSVYGHMQRRMMWQRERDGLFTKGHYLKSRIVCSVYIEIFLFQQMCTDYCQQRCFCRFFMF